MTGADGTASVGTIAGSGLYAETQVQWEESTKPIAPQSDLACCRSLPGSLRQKGTFEHEDVTSVVEKLMNLVWEFIMIDLG